MPLLPRLLLALATISLFAGCGFTKGKEAAARGVDTFHQQFNDSKFPEIYSTATPAFKASTKEPEFLKFMQAVRRKLGAVKAATPNGWNVNTFNGNTSVVLTYKTDFELGSGVETFTFMTSGETATLQGYNVNSQKLITD